MTALCERSSPVCQPQKKKEEEEAKLAAEAKAKADEEGEQAEAEDAVVEEDEDEDAHPGGESETLASPGGWRKEAAGDVAADDGDLDEIQLAEGAGRGGAGGGPSAPGEEIPEIGDVAAPATAAAATAASEAGSSSPWFQRVFSSRKEKVPPLQSPALESSPAATGECGV